MAWKKRQTAGVSPIGTAVWQPVELLDQSGRKLHAAITQIGARFIARALPDTAVIVRANDIGVVDLPGIFILNAHQATQPAAVAERLPLRGSHLNQGFTFPKGFARAIVHQGPLYAAAAQQTAIAAHKPFKTQPD